MKPNYEISQKLNDNWEVQPVPSPYQTRGPFTHKITDFQRHVAQDPLVAAIECAERAHKMRDGFRAELYEVLEEAYAIATYLTANLKEWKLFYEGQPFFQEGKRKLKQRKQQQHILRHVMNFVFKAQSQTTRKRTGKYAAALDPLLKRGLPPYMLQEAIKKEGGIEKMYEISLEEKAAQPKRPSSYQAEDPLLSGLHPGKKSKQGSDFDDFAYDELDEPEDGGDDWNRLLTSDDPKGRLTVEIEVKQFRQDRLFALEKGEVVALLVKCMGVEGSWQRLKTIGAVPWSAKKTK